MNLHITIMIHAFVTCPSFVQGLISTSQGYFMSNMITIPNLALENIIFNSFQFYVKILSPSVWIPYTLRTLFVQTWIVTSQWWSISIYNCISITGSKKNDACFLNFCSIQCMINVKPSDLWSYIPWNHHLYKSKSKHHNHSAKHTLFPFLFLNPE